jgi:hypothetical protein
MAGEQSLRPARHLNCMAHHADVRYGPRVQQAVSARLFRRAFAYQVRRMFETHCRPSIEPGSSRRHLSHGETSISFISFFTAATGRATTHLGSARNALGAVEMDAC